MKIIAAVFFMLGVSPVLAQTAPTPSDEILTSVSEDWQATGIAQKHTVEDVRKLAQAYQALKTENEKLKTENEALKTENEKLKAEPKPKEPAN